jgi:putative spermidine/putrescine transport system substrate-binding protein
MSRRVPRALAALLVAALLAPVLVACGDDDAGSGSAPPATAEGFAAVRDAAQGQTVRWWMYGGDARVNAYVDDVVIPAAGAAGVTLERVPVADTAAAVQRVASQRRAGKTSGGAVDLIWINGENFATGKEAGLWLEGWATALPNARYLDPDDPSIARDFGVPVDGQEAPWSRAAFVFAHDSARVPEPPADLDALLGYARANPGRVTYPAPPDFTGSAFVRQVVAALGEDAAFDYLRELKPLMYRGGEAFPKSEAELNALFADGQVDIAMSYDANFISGAVGKGQFPETTRPFILGEGALANVSFVTIPADAGSPEGAQVVADLLLSPELQARKADPAVLGNPTVLDVSSVPDGRRDTFRAALDSPYYLEDLGEPVEEFAAGRVAPLETRWAREVLRG